MSFWIIFSFWLWASIFFSGVVISNIYKICYFYLYYWTSVIYQSLFLPLSLHHGKVQLLLLLILYSKPGVINNHVFNKVLLKSSYAHLFTYCLGLLCCYGWVELWQRLKDFQNLEQFFLHLLQNVISGPFYSIPELYIEFNNHNFYMVIWIYRNVSY